MTTFIERLKRRPVLVEDHGTALSRRKRRGSESGISLVVTLVLALIIMVALDGFLSYLASEYRMVHRTYSYGTAIYLAEAGIEEGIGMLNYGADNWAANGWSIFQSTNYTKVTNNFTPLGGGSPVGA